MASRRKYVIHPDLTSVQAPDNSEDPKIQIPLPPIPTHPSLRTQQKPSDPNQLQTTRNTQQKHSTPIRNPLEDEIPRSTPRQPLTYYKTRAGKTITSAFPSAAASPVFLSLTHSAFPSKKSILEQWKIPFGLIVRPFARQSRRNVSLPSSFNHVLFVLSFFLSISPEYSLSD